MSPSCVLGSSCLMRSYGKTMNAVPLNLMCVIRDSCFVWMSLCPSGALTNCCIQFYFSALVKTAILFYLVCCTEYHSAWWREGLSLPLALRYPAHLGGMKRITQSEVIAPACCLGLRRRPAVQPPCPWYVLLLPSHLRLGLL